MTGLLNFSKATGRLTAVDKTVAGEPNVIDTNFGNLFTPAPNTFAGWLSLASRSVSSSGVDGSQGTIDTSAEYYIGTPNLASANIVRGLIRYDNPSDNNLWRDAQGTHIEHFDAIGQTLKPQTDSVTKLFVGTQRLLTPMVNKLGHLVLHERVVSRPRDPGSPPTITKTLPATTVYYRLHADFWWGNPLIVQSPDAELAYSISFNNGANAITMNAPAYPYPGRRLVAVIYSTSAIVSVTIGGATATIHDAVVTSIGRITVASVVLSTNPGGAATVAVVVDYGAQFVARRVDIFAVRHMAGSTPIITKTTVASAISASLAVNVPQNKVGIVACYSGSTTECTWTNARKLYDAQSTTYIVGGLNSAIIDPGLGAQNVTASWGGTSGPISLLSMVFD